MLDRVESMCGEMLEFLRELVAIPTVNPPGDNYAACADWLGNLWTNSAMTSSMLPPRAAPNTRPGIRA